MERKTSQEKLETQIILSVLFSHPSPPPSLSPSTFNPSFRIMHEKKVQQSGIKDDKSREEE